MEKTKLKELIDVTRGASLSGEFYSSEGELVRLTLGNFDYNNGGFKANTSKDDLYFIGPIKEEYILEKGDIITPLTEQAVGLLGTTARIPESGKYIQSQDVALVRCKSEKLHHGFCYYLLPSHIVKKQLSAGAQQTSIRHTSPDKIKDCTVFIPNINDQKNIADYLDVIEQKISLNRRINSTLEAMAKQLYDYWFVQFDFPNEEGKPYKSSGGKMVWNEKLKREIPEGWEVKKLGELITLNTNRVSCDQMNNNNYTPIESLPRNKMSFSECAPIEKAVSGLCSYNKKNILLSNRRVYFHKVCIAPFDGYTRDTVMVITPNNTENLGFCYETINTDSFITYATKNSYGTEQPVLPWSSVDKYLIAHSNNIELKYSEQIANIIEKVINSNIEISTLTSLRDFLLPLLMNGQVTINEK